MQARSSWKPYTFLTHSIYIFQPSKNCVYLLNTWPYFFWTQSEKAYILLTQGNIFLNHCLIPCIFSSTVYFFHSLRERLLVAAKLSGLMLLKKECSEIIFFDLIEKRFPTKYMFSTFCKALSSSEVFFKTSQQGMRNIDKASQISEFQLFFFGRKYGSGYGIALLVYFILA